MGVTHLLTIFNNQFLANHVDPFSPKIFPLKHPFSWGSSQPMPRLGTLMQSDLFSAKILQSTSVPALHWVRSLAKPCGVGGWRTIRTSLAMTLQNLWRQNLWISFLGETSPEAIVDHSWMDKDEVEASSASMLARSLNFPLQAASPTGELRHVSPLGSSPCHDLLKKERPRHSWAGPGNLTVGSLLVPGVLSFVPISNYSIDCRKIQCLHVFQRLFPVTAESFCSAWIYSAMPDPFKPTPRPFVSCLIRRQRTAAKDGYISTENLRGQFHSSNFTEVEQLLPV